MRDVSFALQKVEGFLETIGDLLALDYPFRDSQEALRLLKSDFEQLRADLMLARGASERIRQTQAQLALKEIGYKLPILGIIQRSSETCGPVEFHGPFLSLVRRFIPQAKVVIASDWVFSPYTYIYPDLFENQDFVFVSIPFSESDNGLISPLAGHELGHNVWRIENLQDSLLAEANAEVHRLAANEFQRILKEESRASGASGNSQLFETRTTDKAVLWALTQCEEMFCDFLGVGLFREAFLHAFEYLLAPADSPRTVPTYPSMKDRVQAQIQSAARWNVEVPSGYADAFRSSDGIGGAALQMADLVAKALVPKVIELAASSIQRAGLGDPPEPQTVAQIIRDFEGGCPPTNPGSLCALLVAAWKRQIQFSNSLGAVKTDSEYDAFTAELRHNNELLLKSLEILEVMQRMDTAQRPPAANGGEECSTPQQSLL